MRQNSNVKFSFVFYFIFFILVNSLTSSLSANSLKAINFTPTELKNFAGHYSTIAGYVYIRVKGKHVSTRIKGKSILLTKKTDGRIYPTYKIFGLFPIKLGDVSFSLKQYKGKQQVVMYSKKNKQETSMIAGEKFTPKVIPAVWRSRLGRYKAKVLTGKSGIKKIRLAVNNGVLVAFINKLKSPYPLLADANNHLTSPSAGHNRDQKITILVNKTGLSLIYASNKLLLKKL